MAARARLSLSSVLAVCVACASPRGGDDVDWVMNPDPEGGLVDTECVRAGPPLSVLKGQATALARAELGRQLAIRVTAVDELRQELRTSGESVISSESYASLSRQYVDVAISGARTARVGYVTLRDGENFCAMVRLSAEQTRRFYVQMRDGAGDRLSPEDDASLMRALHAREIPSRPGGLGGR